MFCAVIGSSSDVLTRLECVQTRRSWALYISYKTVNKCPRQVCCNVKSRQKSEILRVKAINIRVSLDNSLLIILQYVTLQFPAIPVSSRDTKTSV